MSEPKRYTDLQVWEALHFAGSTNGWIRWEDYARLKAEVERLRNLGIKLDGYVDLLQGENERLRKAGDAMASALILFEMKSEEERQGRIKAWSAAKEGKQP